MMKKISLIVFVFLAIGAAAFGQDLNYKLDTTIQNLINEDQPGVTVLIRHQGEVIYQKGFGMANVEQGVKMEPGHVFRIGSITKQFTACAILKLEEEGKLSLKDDIKKYLPDYPTAGYEISIEHLLTHTSGIKSYTGMQKWTDEVKRKDFKPLELIEYFKVDSLDFKPGDRFSYNNTSYFILGYIIEKVSGMGYEDYIEKSFFEPLEMNHSFYGHSTEIIPMRVSGYEMEDGKLINAPYLSMTQPYSAGSLMSTVGDLDRWYRAVFAGKVVKPESLKKAHTSFVLNNGSETGYGYGWFLGKRLERKTIEHGGGINGSLTKDLFFPEDDLFVAVFSNNTAFPPDPLALKLAAVVLNVDTSKKAITLPASHLKKLVGTYEFEPGFNIEVSLDSDQLMVQATGQSKIPVFPESETKFFLKVAEVDLEFVMSGDEASGLILYQSGAKLIGEKVK